MSELKVRIHNADSMTPFSLAKKFSAAVLLESASLLARGRYSVLMVKEAFRVYQNEDGIYLHMGTKKKQYRVNSKGLRDILDVQQHFAHQFTPGEHPFPVPAGGVCYLSFEFAKYCDTISLKQKHADPKIPIAAALFGHIFLICDHYTNQLYILGLNYKESTINLDKAMDEVEERLHDMDFNYLRVSPTDTSTTTIISDEATIEQQYKEGVKRIQEDILQGEYYQCVLSRRRELQTSMSALDAYRKLRIASPAPYLFYLDFGDFQLYGASPESHLTVKHGRAQIKPLAGTRRRGADFQEDQALEAELLADPKECAEHLMLVDLARNDLGRCSQPNTVKVEEYMHVEYFSKVMHIVSTVSGQLEDKYSGIDMLRASFPAGTVSGAPKIRAIESIDALEPYPRQFYAGVVGYIEAGGALDTCITIRSAMQYEDKIYLQVGAGIVYDSQPEREYQETEEKLSGLMHAFGLSGTKNKP